MDKVSRKRQIIQSSQQNGFSTLGFAIVISAVLGAAGMLMHQINNQRTKTVYEGLNKHQILKGVENDAREWAALLQIAYNNPALDASGRLAILVNSGCNQPPPPPLTPINWTNSKGEALRISCYSVMAIFGATKSFMISAEKTQHNKKYRGNVLLSFAQ